MILEGFVLVTLLLARWVVRWFARKEELRERREFLADRIDELNQRRLLFLRPEVSVRSDADQ